MNDVITFRIFGLAGGFHSHSVEQATATIQNFFKSRPDWGVNPNNIHAIKTSGFWVWENEDNGLPVAREI